MLTRRCFIKSGGLALVGFGWTPPFVQRIAAAGTARKGKILITIFQRGAADGLNIVVPFGEKTYYDLRPTIAIPSPASGQELTALDLDGFFGFHPSLEPVVQHYKDGHLAVVHAAGSPDNTRSHFDAQDYMESGTPGMKSTRDGWLNRYLQANPSRESTPFRAVSMTASMPRTLQGQAPAVAMGNISDFEVKAGDHSDLVQTAFAEMYGKSSSRMLRGAGKDTFAAVEFLKKTNPEQYRPAEGVSYPRGPLGEGLRQIAQLIKADVGLEIGFAESGGWDHHANEGGAQGQLAQRLTDLSQALAAFYKDMGDRMEDIVVLTMSEFGRTARENGNRGTDHGHANVMFVLGGPVKGGRIYGKWPGLAQEQLFEGRDLALTTDFRDVFGAVLLRHLQLKNATPVFPGYSIRQENSLRFL